MEMLGTYEDQPGVRQFIEGQADIYGATAQKYGLNVDDARHIGTSNAKYSARIRKGDVDSLQKIYGAPSERQLAFSMGMGQVSLGEHGFSFANQSAEALDFARNYTSGYVTNLIPRDGAKTLDMQDKLSSYIRGAQSPEELQRIIDTAQQEGGVNSLLADAEKAASSGSATVASSAPAQGQTPKQAPPSVPETETPTSTAPSPNERKIRAWHGSAGKRVQEGSGINIFEADKDGNIILDNDGMPEYTKDYQRTFVNPQNEALRKKGYTEEQISDTWDANRRIQLQTIQDPNNPVSNTITRKQVSDVLRQNSEIMKQIPNAPGNTTENSSSSSSSKTEDSKNALNKADKNADDIFNKTISEAIDKGGDVEAAMKSATTQSETSRYHDYAKHAQSLRKEYLENETARAREAKKNREKYEKQEYFDYVKEHQDKLTEGASSEAKGRFSGMLENMEDARKKNDEQIKRTQGQLKNLEQRKKEFIDDVKPSLGHKVSGKMKNGLGLLKTSLAHPMQAARNITGRLGNTQAFKDLKEAQNAREDAYRQQKGEEAYNKKYGAQEKLKRGRLAVLEERNRQINNMSGNAATYYGSEDRGARAGAQRSMRGAARERIAAGAAKGGKGLSLAGKGKAVLGLLALGGVLGNMMGNHGEQTNAQMYNPSPQPQYYS